HDDDGGRTGYSGAGRLRMAKWQSVRAAHPDPRRLPGEKLEVLRGHGAIARLQLLGRAGLGVFDRLFVRAAFRGIRIGDRLHACDRRLDFAYRTGSDIAARAAAIAIIAGDDVVDPRHRSARALAETDLPG